jgi:hypothetical protein
MTENNQEKKCIILSQADNDGDRLQVSQGMKQYAMENGDLVYVHIKNEDIDAEDFICFCIAYDKKYNLGINILDGSFFIFRQKGLFRKRWVAEDNNKVLNELIENGAVQKMREPVQVFEELPLPETTKPFFDFGGDDPSSEIFFQEGFFLDLWLPPDLIFNKN